MIELSRNRCLNSETAVRQQPFGDSQRCFLRVVTQYAIPCFFCLELFYAPLKHEVSDYIVSLIWRSLEILVSTEVETIGYQRSLEEAQYYLLQSGISSILKKHRS